MAQDCGTSASGVVGLYSNLESAEQNYNVLFADITLDTPRVGEYRDRMVTMQRIDYGRGAVRGTDGIQCWPDFRGDWVFIDKTEASREVSRYRFTDLSSSPPLPFACGIQRLPHVMSFRDPSPARRCAAWTGSWILSMDSRNGPDANFDTMEATK
jgi:hypothetical protein